jgi:fatty-acyl-CoA synthase
VPPPRRDAGRRGGPARREVGRSALRFCGAEARRQATEADIIEFCRLHLARFKVPKRVVFVGLPKTSTGKIQKFVLRNQVKSTSAIE